MRMNYLPKHYQDHADLEYASYVEVDCKGAEFIGDKQTNKNKHSSLYISTERCWRCCTDICAETVAVRVTTMTSAMTTQLTCTTDLVWAFPAKCVDGDRRAATWRPSSATLGSRPVLANRRCLSRHSAVIKIHQWHSCSKDWSTLVGATATLIMRRAYHAQCSSLSPPRRLCFHRRLFVC